tara:strand:+ start:2830 stop:3225 length:396 start_codon:yes stop_codon:yes gene_type:complete
MNHAGSFGFAANYLFTDTDGNRWFVFAPSMKLDYRQIAEGTFAFCLPLNECADGRNGVLTLCEGRQSRVKIRLPMKVVAVMAAIQSWGKVSKVTLKPYPKPTNRFCYFKPEQPVDKLLGSFNDCIDAITAG